MNYSSAPGRHGDLREAASFYRANAGTSLNPSSVTLETVIELAEML